MAWVRVKSTHTHTHRRVRLQTGADTIPFCHQSDVYFWPEAQLIVSLDESTPPLFFSS